VLSYNRASFRCQLMQEAFLTGTPDDVIDQAVQWRDHGLRYIVVANMSTLPAKPTQWSSREHPVGHDPSGAQQAASHLRDIDELEAGNDRKLWRVNS